MSGGDNLDFEIRPNPAAGSRRRARRAAGQPGFGRIFTDHMVTIRYADGKGWYDARVEARAPIPMDPATRGAALRAGDLRGAEGVHARRRRRHDVPAGRQRRAGSASRPQRMAMPPLPRGSCSSSSLRQLITIDREWIPHDRRGQPLPAPVHVRQRGLPRRAPGHGVPLRADRLAGRARTSPAASSRSPCGSRRTTPGRRPAAPARPSAAATTPPACSAQAEAIEHGCDQVVFLDAVERRYVDELGGMNIFFVLRRRHAGHAAADRHDPARHHPRLGHHAGPRAGRRGRGAAGQLRRVARRTRRSGRLARGVRLRHGRGDHPDRHGPAPGRRVHASATAARAR